MMEYKISKNGVCSCVFEVGSPSKPTNVHFVIDDSVERLRSRLVKLMRTAIKKMKPDHGWVSWSTKIGKFNLYKDWELDEGFYDPWKSKYETLYLTVELETKNDVKHWKYSIKKRINKEYEGLEECPTCNDTTLLEHVVVRQGENLNVCKKCKDFDILIEKISKEIDLEDEKNKSKRQKIWVKDGVEG